MCGLGNLAVGESTGIRVVVTIGADRSAEQIVNTASVESETFDPLLPNNEDAATIGVEPEADLSVVKTTSAATPSAATSSPARSRSTTTDPILRPRPS